MVMSALATDGCNRAQYLDARLHPRPGAADGNDRARGHQRAGEFACGGAGTAPPESVVRDVAGRWMRALMTRDFNTAAVMTSLPFVVTAEGQSRAAAPAASCRTAKRAGELPRALDCLQKLAASFDQDWTGLDGDFSDYPINVRVPFLSGDRRRSARSVGFFTSNDCPVRVLVAVAARPEGARVVGISLVQFNCIHQPRSRN